MVRRRIFAILRQEAAKMTIAEKLGMKLPTVKSKLQRTREKLRRKLTERGYSV